MDRGQESMRLIKPALICAWGATPGIWNPCERMLREADWRLSTTQISDKMTIMWQVYIEHKCTPIHQTCLFMFIVSKVFPSWVRCIPRKYMVTLADNCPSVTKMSRCCLEEDSRVTWPKKQSYCQSSANCLVKIWNPSEREIPQCLLKSVPALLCPPILFILPAFQRLKSELNPWSSGIAPCLTLYWEGFESTIFVVILL